MGIRGIAGIFPHAAIPVNLPAVSVLRLPLSPVTRVLSREVRITGVEGHDYVCLTDLAHYRTLQALPLILGPGRQDDADYLDACRSKRNTAEYDSVGCVSTDEARELVAFAAGLRQDVKSWLRDNHPELS
jgi:hypothetical protein